MTDHAKDAHEIAQRVWDRTTTGSNSPEEVAVAVERLFAQLRTGLLPWVGAEGYRALLDRALGDVENGHPAIGSLPFFGGDEPLNTEGHRTYGIEEVAAATVALVTALIEVLGRIIGQDLAVRLVDQIDMPRPLGVAWTPTDGLKNE